MLQRLRKSFAQQQTVLKAVYGAKPPYRTKRSLSILPGLKTGLRRQDDALYRAGQTRVAVVWRQIRQYDHLSRMPDAEDLIYSFLCSSFFRRKRLFPNCLCNRAFLDETGAGSRHSGIFRSRLQLQSCTRRFHSQHQRRGSAPQPEQFPGQRRSATEESACGRTGPTLKGGAPVLR